MMIERCDHNYPPVPFEEGIHRVACLKCGAETQVRLRMGPPDPNAEPFFGDHPGDHVLERAPESPTRPPGGG